MELQGGGKSWDVEPKDLKTLLGKKEEGFNSSTKEALQELYFNVLGSNQYFGWCEALAKGRGRVRERK